MLSNSQQNKKRQKLLQDSAQRKERFKMYKAGRNWFFAGITVLIFGAGVYLNSPVVSADTTADSSSSTALASSAASQSEATSQNNSSATNTTTKAAVASNSAETTSSAAATSSSVSSDTSSSQSASENTSSSAVSSVAASSSNSNTQTTSATDTQALSSATDETATSDMTNTSSAVFQTSNVSSATSKTTTSAASSANSRVAPRVASSEAVTSETDQEKIATLSDALPESTDVTVQSDGTILIALPSDYDDVALVQQAIDDAQLKSAVEITAKAAAETGPKTWDGDSSGDVFNDAMYNIANAVTMGDFEWMTAVGTGMLNGKAATLDEIDSYFQGLYNDNKGNYRLLSLLKTFDGSGSESDKEAEANAAAFDYYYFLGSDDSYVNNLIDYLQGLSTAQLATLAQTAYTASQNSDVTQLISQASDFVLHTFYPAGTSSPVSTSGGNEFKNPSAATGTAGNYWKIPFTDTTEVKNFSDFVNTIVSLYIGAIVPGAEAYVIKTVLPAIDTVSDTTALTDYTSLDSILSQIGADNYQTAKDLMTIDGTFDLTSIVSHIKMLYQTNYLLTLTDSGSGGFLGRYVGAFDRTKTTDGNTLTYNDSTLNGNGIGFKNFSLFNNLYVAYSEALVKVLYGTAMLGKFEGIQAMYDDTDAFVSYMKDITDPSQIDINDFETKVLNLTTTNTLTTDTETQMYQQGIWDAYHYIYPFYEAGLQDKAAGTGIQSSSYTDNDDFLNAVWTRASKDAVTGDGSIQVYNADKKTSAAAVVDLTTDDAGSTDANPHDDQTQTSAQTIAYLVAFYNSALNSNDASQVAYQVQPVSRVTIKDADGNVINTIDKNIGTVSGDIEGTPGSVVSATTLPDVLGYKTPTQDELNGLKLYVPENGGILNVPYTNTDQTAGTETADFVNANPDATYDYTITYENGTVVSTGTGVKAADVTFDLDAGQTLTISAKTNNTGYVVVGADTTTVNYDKTTQSYTIPYEASGGTVTFTFATTPVDYTIQPVYQSGTDATTGAPIYTSIANAVTASGTPGQDIDTTKIPDVNGYTKPTYADTDAIPDVPVVDGGVVDVVYTADEVAAQVQVTETGAPDGTDFTYTVNDGAVQTGEYTDGSALIDADVGDVVVITPLTVAGYSLTGTDKSEITKTITVDDKNIDDTISPNNTANFVYTAVPQAITVKYINEATGEQLGDSATLKGVTGGTYKVTPSDYLTVNYVSGVEKDTISSDILNQVNVFKLDVDKTGSLTGTYVDKDKTTLTIYYAPESFSFKTEFFTKNTDGSFTDVGEGTISYDAATDKISYDGPAISGQPVSTLIHVLDSDKYVESGDPASGVITATSTGLNFNVSPTTGVLSFASATLDSTVPSATTQPYMEVNPKLTYGSFTVNRTVHFEGAGSATPEDVTQTATYATVTNAVTNETAYTLQSVKNVAIAAITGFTAMIGTTPVKKNDDGSYSPVDSSDFDSATLSTPTVPDDITITYVANDETVTVTATGNIGDTGFAYTVNGGDSITGCYATNGSIAAKFGDEIVITPDIQKGYSITGNDSGKNSTTIIVGDSDSDNSVAFVYSAREAAGVVTVHYVDEQGNAIDGVEDGTIGGTGYYVGDKVTPEQKMIDHYTYVSGADEITLTDTNTSINVVYSFNGVTVTTPTNPSDPVDPANPDGPKMPTITEADLTQSVSREISYEVAASDDPNAPKAPTKVTQTTKYTRGAVIDKTTGELIGYT
ncbi:KxYKxGKxW signal peptide domain-containing protein, partial [Pediococcus cellicola]